MAAKGAPTFAQCGVALSEQSLAAVRSLGFSHMTPVQAAAVPLFLAHKDVCVEACTGSGKTVAFLLPAFEMLRRRDVPLAASQVGAVVIAPTRELARQIFGVCEHFCAHHTEFKAMLLVGGTDIAETLQQLDSTGANILIGTPGRMLDVLKRSDAQYVKELEVLILDEADTLLDMGFQAALNEILGLLPKQRRTGLFSATQTVEVKELARAGMRNPVTVKVQVESKAKLQATPSQLMNYFLCVPYHQKPAQLVHFLKMHQQEKILVFAMTCAAVDFWTGILRELPQLADMRENIMGLHGKMVPAKRTGTYDRFVQLERGVLICTDVAARGIDIPDVDWIVQYDAPKDPSFFIHRVGRTARAGRAGRALLMLSDQEDAFVNFLELKNVPMTPLAPYQDVEDVLEPMKACVKSDRALLEQGTEAFIGFLRAYKEHHCSYIFRMEALDVGAVARSYALLRLPKIKELRLNSVEFEADDIDTSLIPYKQKAREVARQRRLQAQREENEQKRKAQEEQSEKKRKQREEQQKQQQQKKKPKGKHQHILAEWDELAREELLFKRFKKGKMSKSQYDKSLLRWKNEDGDLELDGARARSGSNDDSDGGDSFEGGSSDSDSDVAPQAKKPKAVPTSNGSSHRAKPKKQQRRGRK